MKKVFLMILSLAMILSSMTAVSVSAADEESLLPDGYEFIDIAYNGNGTYAAMAKNADYSSARMFYSNDGGVTWQASGNQPISNATVYINRPSQQQLIWWDSQGLFVAKGAAEAYTSPDGYTWTANSDIHWSSNAMVTTNGDYLIYASANGLRLTDSADTLQDRYAAPALSEANYFKAVAAKPDDGTGKVSVFAAGQNLACDLSFTADGSGICTWNQDNSASGGSIPMEILDMVYAEGADQFLMIDGTESLIVANSSQAVTALTVKEGVNVTGVGTSSDYIVVGMSDGTMYYTANAPVNAETQWTEIPPAEGAATASEPIKNIEFSSSTEFAALGTTQIYKCDINGYMNINEYVELGDIEISGQNIFNGVRLIGGTYSETLNKYVVYGDTTTADADGRYWGKIFASDDGLDWREVYTGYTFSYRNLNEDGSLRSYTEVRNGAVWWESQGIFIVSASTMDHSGVTLVSEDGESWKAILSTGNTDAEGNPTPEVDTDFRLNADITVAGDKLYTTNNGRQFRTYTAWNKDSMTWVGVTNVPNTWYMNQIAVSNESDPAVLIAQNANGAVRNNESDAAEELDKWTQINAIGGAGALTDAVFSESLNKFVAVLNTGLRTSIVSKDGAVEQGPVVPGEIVCKAIDTNGEVFMLAGEDGNVYTAPDTADFKYGVTSLAAVPAADIVEAENTAPLTNVFKADDKFIATASNGTSSDVLLIAKNNSDAYEYVRASENSKAEELVPGQTITITVSGINNTTNDYPFELITAVYFDGVLMQVQTDELSIAGGTSGEVSAEVTLNEELPEDSVMKIFLWDSISGMVPVKSAVTPF